MDAESGNVLQDLWPGAQTKINYIYHDSSCVQKAVLPLFLHIRRSVLKYPYLLHIYTKNVRKRVYIIIIQ